MVTQTIFDAYTKINPYNKERLINFLCQNHKRGFDVSCDCNLAVEYALKEIPSFGGFVLIAELEANIVAALIVNRSGIQGNNSQNNLVYFEVKEGFHKIGRNLLDKAIKLSNSDISIHLEPDNPMMDLFVKMGFQPAHVVMRFDAPEAKKSIA